MSTSRRVYRYTVPVDDRVHTFELTGPVIGWACRERAKVEFWAEHGSWAHPITEHFRVYGTGHPISSAQAIAVGSVIDGPFVWHLYKATQAVHLRS